MENIEDSLGGESIAWEVGYCSIVLSSSSFRLSDHTVLKLSKQEYDVAKSLKSEIDRCMLILLQLNLWRTDFLLCMLRHFQSYQSSALQDIEIRDLQICKIWYHFLLRKIQEIQKRCHSWLHHRMVAVQVAAPMWGGGRERDESRATSLAARRGASSSRKFWESPVGCSLLAVEVRIYEALNVWYNEIYMI